MDLLTFIAAIVSALAWPVTLLFALLILRKPLFGLVSLIQKLKYKDVEVEFGKGVRELRQDIVQNLPEQVSTAASHFTDGRAASLVSVSPRAGVLEAWREIELAAMSALRRLSPKAIANQTLTFQVIRLLESMPGVDTKIITLLKDLRALRNDAAHAPEFALSQESALEYVASAHAVAEYLRNLKAAP